MSTLPLTRAFLIIPFCLPRVVRALAFNPSKNKNHSIWSFSLVRPLEGDWRCVATSSFLLLLLLQFFFFFFFLRFLFKIFFSKGMWGTYEECLSVDLFLILVFLFIVISYHKLLDWMVQIGRIPYILNQNNVHERHPSLIKCNGGKFL